MDNYPFICVLRIMTVIADLRSRVGYNELDELHQLIPPQPCRRYRGLPSESILSRFASLNVHPPPIITNTRSIGRSTAYP